MRVALDIGTVGIRAAGVRGTGKDAVVEMVASRAVPTGAVEADRVGDPEIVAAAIDELLREIGSPGRECVLSVGTASAELRPLSLPRMTRRERLAAARLDVERRLGTSAAERVVRAATCESGRCVVGIVDAAALRSRVQTARRAGLRPIAVDFDGCALRRAFPDDDAVLDVGYTRTVLHAEGEPLSLWAGRAGNALTRSIADDLGIDEAAAERRKRTLGTAGAGEAALDEIVRDAAELVRAVRRRGRAIARIALCGNGSRVPGFASALEREADVRIAASRPRGLSEAYPDDVATASAADWALAVGLASWTRP